MRAVLDRTIESILGLPDDADPPLISVKCVRVANRSLVSSILSRTRAVGGNAGVRASLDHCNLVKKSRDGEIFVLIDDECVDLENDKDLVVNQVFVPKYAPFTSEQAKRWTEKFW